MARTISPRTRQSRDRAPTLCCKAADLGWRWRNAAKCNSCRSRRRSAQSCQHRQSSSFRPFVDLYRRSFHEAGHDLADCKVGISSHLHIQQDSQSALDEFYPHYSRYIGHNLPNGCDGWKVSRQDYERLAGPRGALFVGSPQQIIDKILYEYELFGHDRFMAQIDIGGLPFNKVAKAIDHLGSEVLPAVRKATAGLKPDDAQKPLSVVAET
ncbi:LLM class flavin-dependent oxidoreductase [Agrobacterium rosae]|uniref:LLM class flavin-dependent oxidoreductase n=1 Tax=Agrobacterium rosae TaxID=1972867 RepID=UPI0019D3EE79|nr:LLM class flavin-dependent oxidoreductase [Agrobacterium rosae]